MTQQQIILDQFLKIAQEQKLNINYIQISQAGKTVVNFSRLHASTRLETYSVSKSFSSIGVGIALDEGLISLDEHLYTNFQEYELKDIYCHAQKIRVKDLLTMSCGFETPHFFRDDKLRYETKDWISYFFQQDFPNVPGEKFVYSNFNTYMLAALIEKKSGENFVDYLKPRLFNKIGIKSPDWSHCPKGHCHAAFGLNLTVEEMTKFGQLLLNDGIFNGERVISSSYIRIATKNQIKKNIPNSGYGFQFWINPDKFSFRADGKFGQYIIVLPEKELIVAVQSLEEQNYFDFLWSNLIVHL